MNRVTFKSVVISIFLALLVGCGGGSGSAVIISSDAVDDSNSKRIFFKSDFDSDSSLRVATNDIAIFQLDNRTESNERIPFTIAQTGEHELCMESADNILRAAIVNAQDQDVLTINPAFTLDCLLVQLGAGNYFLRLNYFNKIASDMDAPVPFVRLDEKTELKAGVDISDWNAELLAEAIRAGLLTPPTFLSDSSTLIRICYTTPTSNDSIATFRIDGNKLRLSFKPDLSAGETYQCSYQIPNVVLGPGDIGDIDAIVRQYVNRSLLSSRPKPGNQSVSIQSEILLQFKGSIGATPASSAFSISPTLPGVVSIQGQVLKFVPSSAFANDTLYNVVVSSLSENGSAIDDINFSFRSEKALNLTGNESSLTNTQLCALGLSEFCAEVHFSDITSSSAAISSPSTSGSRLLQVTTTLDQPTPSDIVFEYQFIDSRDQSIIGQDKFVVTYGNTTSNNIIAWPIDDFEKVIHSASMKITKISNAFGALNSTGSWSVYNGELYNTPGEVQVTEPNPSIITNIALSGNISSADLALTISLDQAAQEAVYVEFLIDGGCQWRSGVNEVCLDPGVVSIPANTTQFAIALPEPDGTRFVIGSSAITVTVSNTRNVTAGAGLVDTKLLDGIVVTPPIINP